MGNWGRGPKPHAKHYALLPARRNPRFADALKNRLSPRLAAGFKTRVTTGPTLDHISASRRKITERNDVVDLLI